MQITKKMDHVNDQRRQYILNSTGNFFGIKNIEESTLKNEQAVLDFLNDGSCFTLCACSFPEASSGGQTITFENKVAPNNAEQVLVFFKTRPDIITVDNMHSIVFVSSIQESPVQSLYHSIQRVFIPALLQNGTQTSVDPQLQELISQLESGLKTAIHNGAEASDCLAAIFNISDECQYWKTVVKTSKSKRDKDQALIIYNLLKPLEKEILSLQGSKGLLEVEDMLEMAHGTLDELWHVEDAAYPQKRMEHLMQIIGNSLTKVVQVRLQNVDIWKEDFLVVEKTLKQSITASIKWLESCKKLTSIFWANFSSHQWKGNVCEPSYLKKFVLRLQEILRIRTLHYQLSILLTSEERQEMKMDKALLHFSVINSTQCSPYTEGDWKAAVIDFEKLVEPTEEKVSSRLQAKIQQENSHPLQVLQEMQKQGALVSRPNMLRLLTSQRESLLASLSTVIKDSHSELNSRQGLQSSSVTENVTWARQLESKLSDIQSAGKVLLEDLSGYPKHQQMTENLVRDLQEFRTDIVDTWTREMSAALTNRSLGLKMDAPVVQFESGHQLMKVNYDPKLVALVREVRQLTVLGHKIPSQIKNATDLAKKFMRQAKALEKIATFHNTIGDRMVPSQRPMMLEAALALAQLVQQESQVTWSDLRAVELYLSKLQAAVERLAKQNNFLATHHAKIRTKVLALMSTDLLRSQSQWKDGVREIRDIFMQVESQKFSNMKAWRSHWDRQLYKALEFQYQVGLEALSEHLPEMKIELVFRQQQLQFQPPMEEIRSKYYGQLKRFLSIPNLFRGVGDGKENLIFPTIIERNAHRFGPLFARAEELFGRLDALKSRFMRWVALGSVDLDLMAQKHLNNASDWDTNFRASKAWGQEIARLTCLEEKIECFTISYLPVRAEAEVHNRRYWDVLAGSLQASIARDATDIERFAKEGMETLRQQPQTVEEIGVASMKHSQLTKEVPEMLARYEAGLKKNKTLASWTKERVDALDKVADVWENFQATLGNHDSLISRQVESIKASLETRKEELIGQSEKFWLRWQQLRPSESKLQEGGSEALQVVLTSLVERRAEWDALQQARDKLSEEYQQFGLQPVDVTNWEDIEKDLKSHEETWSLFNEFQTGINEISTEEWIIFRSKSFKFEEFLLLWDQKLHNGESAGGVTPVAARLLKEIEQYKGIIPAMKFIKGDMFSDKHWMEMLDLLGITNKPVESLIFKDFLQARDKIVSNLDQLKDLNARAASEIVIRQALSELDVWEIEAKFTLFEHVDSQRRHVLLVQDYKDILNKVGDNQCLLQSIKSSPNFDSFADQASIWEKRLATLDECLRNLTQIQRKWLYLEPIFGVGTLAHDKARFHRVDVDFRNIATDMARDRRVVSLCKKSGLSLLLNKLLDQLARCQKSLNDFLEEKRSAFPRFYFIGDDDLLEILGQSTKEKVVQAHLKKLFAGIHSVDFDKSGQRIIAMKSLDGEVVSLSKAITVTQNVEQWLSQLVEEMRSSLKKLLVQCLDDARRSQGGPDPLSYPSQVLCLAESILFTERCETAIHAGKLHTLLATLKSQLEGYTSQELVSEGDSDVLELKLRALVLDTIHHMIMVEELLVCPSLNVESWAWQKQLRFYIQADGSAVARMVNAEFSYTYEYLGNAPKLVHTPLTDKCYLTLTQAMHMGLGGNPLGPAGTGKTESVKALGGLFGRQVLVFNCDEGIDVTSMARIFVGLVKCGAWGCFDEFNRLEEATLSAISMQIQPIQAALRGKHKSVTLLDTEVQLDPNAGIFVTMNPAGKGYGGRQQLPDNLKQLFRPVVMAQPDNEQIASVLLHTEGFQHAADLGAKLVEVFNLAKCLLSSQQHYDWGLRALKTVLRGCGSALRNVRKSGKAKLSAEAEAELAVQALRLNTLSKLTSADCERLDALLGDIFPGIKLTEGSDERLVQALRASCQQLQLEENPNQIKKCLELYEQLQQRMGVVIVGPTGSGKSTLCKMLRHALNSQGHTVRQYTINPKAMMRSQLLGYVDQDTRQWQDGVLTISAQQVHAEPPEVTSWVLCDGDIDPEWVESLNSVLDDNRLLTLPSGWRIQFGPNVNFLFETHDLSQASPATISRMGMILLSEEDVSIKHVVSVWLKQKSLEENIAQLIEEHFYKAVEWVQSHGEPVVPWSLIGIVRAGLSQLSEVSSRAHFTCALIRGLGGNLSESTRQAFADKVLEWTGEFIHDPSRVLTCYYDEKRDCLDTYSTDELEVVPEGEGNRLVLTSNVKSILGHLEAWFQSDIKYPFLLVGPQGCGKSTILKYCFNQLRSTEVAEIHCSAQITPQHVLQKLSQVTMSISSNTGRMLRPKNTEHLVLYFRDLNLAKPDKWGTSMLIAFLQQILTYGGFYDQSLEWVGVEGIQIIGSMTTSTSSGRHTLSSRFTSLVAIHACSYPDSTTLRSIYGSLLYHTLAPTLPQFSQLKSSGKLLTLIDTMIRVYTEVSTAFSPLQNNHYIFTPYFLTRWCQGLARYSFDGGRDLVESLLQVVVHECQRLFRDMLVSTEDCSKFDSILSSVIEEAWNKSISAIITKLSDSFYVSVGSVSGKRNDIYPHGKPLGPLSKNDWTTIVEKTLAQYGREQQPLGLLVIPELLKGMAITERILTCPYGSLLLAGRAGAGRKSCIKLVATLHAARLFTLSMASGYGIKHFKKDLKAAMQVAGAEAEQVYFLIEDHQLVEANFLDMLNSLLSSGEVPGLYANDELEPLVSPLKDMAAQEGFSGSPAAYFAERVRQNLHLVLVMDCTDVNFIKNCESNPALYKHCAIQWWETWDKESMLKVPQLLLQKAEEGDDDLLESESVADQLISHLMTIHSEAPHFLLSPRRYVAFVHLYKHILSSKQKNIKERQGRLKAGVSKLTEARSVVAELRSQAELQEKQLAEKQEEAATALHLISETMQGANTQKSEMESLKDQTLKENEELLKRKKAIDVELAEIEPLVQEAQAAVGNIKTEALSEIRSLRAPPDVIRDILEGVLRLMGIQDTSWNSMKTFLAKRGVKEDIRSFNARNINSENRHAVEKLLKEKRESFDPKNAKRASVAAAPLASWVTANVKYSVVLEKIRPLEREQNKLHKNLRAAEDHIGQLSTDLSDVNARVAELKERLNTYTKEAAEIEIHLTKAKDTLLAAETLVGKLNEEYERWRIQLTELSGDLNELPLQALLAAAFIAYLPGVPEEKRRTLLTEWQQILGLQDFSLARFLASEQELLQWQAEGLPSDQVSIENAVVILQTVILDPGTGLRPLLVDPSSQACDWLKKHLQDRPVEVVAQSNERFTTLLELAVRFGKVLIIPEVDQISPILLPLLRGDFTSQGARCVVAIGEKMVDYHKDFQLFLVSRNLCPDISPTAASVISLVNFATTPAGLGAQLLSTALRHDKPELETRRGDLLREEERLRARLQQLQENLLLELASAQGDVLQNKELLASLNETKASSAAIATSLSESSRLQEALGSERELYRPLSEFASRLYFATQDLSRTNRTYQFSVATFCRLFHSSLHVTQAEESTEARILTVKRYLIRIVYDHVGRSLFKADRLMFAIHLVHKMYPELVPQNEWEVFTGQAIPDPSASKVPNWIIEERVNAVRLLQSALPTLYASLQLSDERAWSQFTVHGECESHLPDHLANMTQFQQVLLVQALRPDRFHSMLNIFAQKSLGLHDLSPSALSLKKLLSETQASEPILLLALTGVDPSEELRAMAVNTVGDQAFREVALGQGQVELAERLLQEAAQNGQWLCLKNLHLVCKWVPVLESILRSLQPHKNFRLWITSQPHPALSAVLLQGCLKITYEAPQGIKRNLQRTYAGWGREMIEKPGQQSVLRIQSLFALAWLHAILQERSTYVPQGWSRAYEFSDSDLRSAALILEPLVATGKIKWDYIYGLYESAIYGGRIDNTYDIRVLSVYLREYFNTSSLTGVKSFGPGITLPTSAKFTDSLNVISQLPDQDKPQLFGLPANIDRSWQRLTSQRVIHQLLVLNRPEKGSIKFDLNKWESQLTPIFNLWKKLNQGSGLVQVKLPSEISKASDKPVQQFCALEWRSAVNLVQKVHRSLASLLRVVKGATLPNNEVIEIAEAIMQHQTPPAWLQIWEGPTDPLLFVRNVVSRALAVQSWLHKSMQNQLLQENLNLSELFHPNTFLSALKQQTAREYNLAMSELHLVSSWSSVLPSARLSVRVSGLHIEGAKFTSGSLTEASPDSPSVEPLTTCILAWIPKKEKSASKSSVEVPVYQSVSRKQLVTSLELACSGDKAKWMLASVALFLEL